MKWENQSESMLKSPQKLQKSLR